MIFKDTLKIHNWNDCDHEINETVLKFKDYFSVYPNIIFFNALSYSKIGILANKNKKNLKNEDGENPEKNEFAALACFKGEHYELDFCVDETLSY